MCDFRLSYGRVLNRRSKIIAVNRDKTQLLKNSDMFWKPTIAIQGMCRRVPLIFSGYCCPVRGRFQQVSTSTTQLSVWVVVGDAGSFLVRLSEGLKGHRCPEDWPQSLKAGDETKENANRYNVCVSPQVLRWNMLTSSLDGETHINGHECLV